MIHLKHVSCSGRLDRMWQYDPARRLVIVVVDGRGANIPVATEGNPRHGAYSIRRIDEASFEIVPSIFNRRGAHWGAYVANYPDDALPTMTIQLTHAPPDVTAEMDQLSYEPCPEPDPE